MNFFAEWILAVHRAIWFPALWLSGLEATPVDAEAEWRSTPRRSTVRGLPRKTTLRESPVGLVRRRAA